MIESQRVPVTTAAKLLGISPAELRYRMQMDRNKPKEEQVYPIGVSKKSKSGKTYRCEIYRGLLQKHLGLTDEEWGREVNDDRV